MGLIACYYVVEDNIIDKTIHLNFDYESYLENNFSDEELKYLVYGQDIKSWNPLFELLKIIDTSKTKVLSRIDNDDFYVKESVNMPSFYYHNSKRVNEIWRELKNITSEKITKSLQKEKLKERISNIEGYYNERIHYTESILIEYNEIYDAFESAHKLKRGIIITIS
jgi:hypothetical protein